MVRRIVVSVLLLGLGTVVGQVITSVAIDALWPTSAAPTLGQSLLMSALAILSVIVAAVPWRRMPRDRR